MRAVTVVPGKSASAGVGEISEPDEADGSVLVEGLYIGICGTDVEIIPDGYGAAPDGRPAGARARVAGPGRRGTQVADVIIEATGAGPLVFECARLLGPGGVMCLTRISSRTDAIGVPMAQLNRQLVLDNAVIVGS